MDCIPVRQIICVARRRDREDKARVREVRQAAKMERKAKFRQQQQQDGDESGPVAFLGGGSDDNPSDDHSDVGDGDQGGSLRQREGRHVDIEIPEKRITATSAAPGHKRKRGSVNELSLVQQETLALQLLSSSK